LEENSCVEAAVENKDIEEYINWVKKKKRGWIEVITRTTVYPIKSITLLFIEISNSYFSWHRMF